MAYRGDVTVERMSVRDALLLLALALQLALSACAEKQYAKAIDGLVVDADTHQPIAGAYVYYLYEGPPATSLGGHQASDVCYHASAAVTDERGRFHIDPWEQPRRYGVENWEPTGWAYAKGYVPWQMPLKDRVRKSPRPRPDELFALTKSRATGDARLDELWNFARWGCLHGGASHRELFPALKAVYDEAKSAASTAAQKERLEGFRTTAAFAFVAPDPVSGGDNWTKEIQTFMKERLP